jgi:hypothetical protein
MKTDRFGMVLLTGSSVNNANCINIVNVAVAERNRRKGFFTDFLELLEGFDYGSYLKNDSDFHLWIDKVMNPVLDEYFFRPTFESSCSNGSLRAIPWRAHRPRHRRLCRRLFFSSWPDSFFLHVDYSGFGS